MICSTLLCGLLAAGSPSSALPQAPPSGPETVADVTGAARELADIVRDFCDREKILGAEVLVLKGRRTVLHEGIGWRDRDDGVPMEPGTIFNLRSMTKAVVGAAAQALVDEGRLALDDPVAKYLPAFDTGACRAITVDQVLSHRAGFPMTILTALDEFPDLQAQAAAVAAHGPDFEPGSRFWYSDAGADVMGALVEAASGEKLDVFVTRCILEPLGMRDSFFSAPPDDPRWQRVASAYAATPGGWIRFWKPAGRSMYAFAWGSQSLYGTPADYCRFLAMWASGGLAADGTRVLSERAVASQIEPVSAMSALGTEMGMPTGFPGKEVWYGRMAVLYRDAGAAPGSPSPILSHSGSDGTIAWIWPGHDLAVALFTQSRGGSGLLRLEAEIHRLFFEPGINDGVPREWRSLTGTYVPQVGDLAGKEVDVIVQNGILCVDVPGQMVFRLREPDDAGWRAFELDPRIRIRFVAGEDGAVDAFAFLAPGQEEPALARRGTAAEYRVRHPATKAVAADLTRFLGVYHDVEGDAEVRMVDRNGKLAAEHPAVPVPLEFDGPDAEGFFTLKVNPAVRIRFTEDENGRVTGYEVHAGGQVTLRPRLRDLDSQPGGT